MRRLGWPARAPGPSALESGSDRITRIVRSHGEFIWRVLRRLGLSSENAEDASQQVFMIVARKLHRLPHDTERVFLYGTAVRVAANLRRGMRRRRENGDAELELLPSGTASPDLLLEEQERLAKLDALLAELPDELRRAFILSEIEGLTGKEVAELEGIPAGTVASRLRRARELVFARAQASEALHDAAAMRACVGDTRAT